MFFIILLSMIFCYHYKVKIIKLRYIFFISLSVFILFFSFHEFRKPKSEKDVGGLDNNEIRYFHEVTRKMFFSTEHFLVVLSIPPPPKILGKSFLEPFLVWIPRFLWQDKPILGISSFYMNYYFPQIRGKGITYGPGIIGAILLNFGVIGVIVQFFMLGLILKWLYNKFKDKMQEDDFFILYTLTISTIIFIGISRNVISSITLLTFFLVPLTGYIIIREILMFLSGMNYND